MQAKTLAREIANFSLFQLKNRVEPIREMSSAEQDEVGKIIRDAAVRVLSQNKDREMKYR